MPYPAKKKLLDVRIVKSEDWCKKCVPKQCVWKLGWTDLCDKFCETFTAEMNDTTGEQVDNLVEVETKFAPCYREDLMVDKERHAEKTKIVVE